MIRAIGVSKRVNTWTKENRDIYSALETQLRDILPRDVEVRTAWAGIGFKVGKNWSCMVYPGKVGCNVMIYQGIKLNDRFGVLDGIGTSTRNFRAADLGYNQEALKDLIEQQQVLYRTGVRWE